MKTLNLTLVAATALLAGSSGLGQDYTFSAGQGVISAPFILTDGYVFQQMETGVTNGGKAVYWFTTEAADCRYVLSATVESPTPGSLFINIDAEPTDPGMKWSFPASSCSTNIPVTFSGTAREFTLTNGVHQLIVRGCHPNVKLWGISVSRPIPPSRPAPPTGLHLITGP